jgi:5-methylcytosine-specific restriction endonuclease McrA
MGRDKEKHREATRAWKAKHRAELLAYSKAYDATRRDKSKRPAMNQAYYAANKDTIAAKRKRAYAVDPAPAMARANAWRATNHGKHLDYGGRWRAAQRNAKSEHVDLAQILRDANGLCGICGEPFDLDGIHFDHKVPLAKGGTHTTDNIQATHARCNRAKGEKVAS